MKILSRLKWLYATVMIFTSMTFMIIIFYLVPKPYAVKISAWLIRWFIFIPVSIKGKEDPKAQMFLLNHQSDIDIGVMETITSRDLAWVAKKELFDVPFFGLLVKLPKDIAVERESKTALIKLIRDAKERLDDNRVITIFPEGTRSATGKMRNFKMGAKMVADKYALRVQPVVLIATAARYDIKKFHYKPSRVTAIYMDSFDADKRDKEWLNTLKDKMQKVYDHELANPSSHR